MKTIFLELCQWTICSNLLGNPRVYRKLILLTHKQRLEIIKMIRKMWIGICLGLFVMFYRNKMYIEHEYRRQLVTNTASRFFQWNTRFPRHPVRYGNDAWLQGSSASLLCYTVEGFSKPCFQCIVILYLSSSFFTSTNSICSHGDHFYQQGSFTTRI